MTEIDSQLSESQIISKLPKEPLIYQNNSPLNFGFKVIDPADTRAESLNRLKKLGSQNVTRPNSAAIISTSFKPRKSQNRVAIFEEPKV